MRQKEELNAVAFQVAAGRQQGGDPHRRWRASSTSRWPAVRTASYEGKLEAHGQLPRGRRPDWKKAVVTLPAGHKIDLVEGA